MTRPNAGVLYALETTLGAAEFRQVLAGCSLGATRPIDDEARLAAMLAGASLIVTARLAQPQRPIVGVLRGMNDGAWTCYVSEVAVSDSAQGLGIGRGLIDEARRLIGPRVSLILASMPNAVGFYERIGMQRLPDTFWFRRQS